VLIKTDKQQQQQWQQCWLAVAALQSRRESMLALAEVSGSWGADYAIYGRHAAAAVLAGSCSSAEHVRLHAGTG
jgi:hypothetical protein